MKLINKSIRALGVPGARASIVVQVGQSVPITEKDLSAIKANSMAARWLESGALVIEGDSIKKEDETSIVLPEKETELLVKDESSNESASDQLDKAIVRHVGAGRYNAFVSDEPLSDKPLDKAEAESLAGEYNASSN
jgi:hypothetical protein